MTKTLLVFFGILLMTSCVDAKTFIMLANPALPGGDPPFVTLAQSGGHTMVASCACANASCVLSASVDFYVVSSTCAITDVRTALPDLHLSTKGIMTWDTAYCRPSDSGAGPESIFMQLSGSARTSVTVTVLDRVHAVSAFATAPTYSWKSASFPTEPWNGLQVSSKGPHVRALLADAANNDWFSLGTVEVGGTLLQSRIANGRRLFIGLSDDLALANSGDSYESSLEQVILASLNWTGELNSSPTINAVTLPPQNVPDNTTHRIEVANILQAVSWADPDSAWGQVFPGIALVTQSVGTGGVWQYSTDGTTWTDVASPALGDAIQLDPTSSLRFSPQLGALGLKTLTFRGWDRTNFDPSKVPSGTRDNHSVSPSQGEGAVSSNEAVAQVIISSSATTSTVASSSSVGPATTTTAATAAATATAAAATTTSTAATTTTTSTAATTTATSTVASTVASTTGTASTGAAANSEEGSESEPFPWWIIAAAVGGCCCILLVLLAVFLVRRRKAQSSDTADVPLGAMTVEADDEEGGEYDCIAFCRNPTETNYQSILRAAVDVAEEQNYATITTQKEVVHGTYGKIPKKATAADGTQSNELDPNEVMLDTSGSIGKGSFGDVFRGSYRGVDVAVKMLKQGFTEDQIQSFYGEVATIAAIPVHEFIVGYVGCCPSPFMIITEFCSQGSLLRFLRSSKTAALKPEQSLKLIKDIAAGMAHLALHGIVHRDLAARNVLLTGKLVPKISDFGMSRKLEEGMESHNSKTSTGPVRWMSVEAIRKGKFSEASDVWAFAVTAFECLSQGLTPYGKNTPTMQVARDVIAGKRLEFPETISASMDELFQSCMHENPEKRPKFSKIVSEMEEASEDVIYADLGTFGTLEADGTVGRDNGINLNEFRD